MAESTTAHVTTEATDAPGTTGAPGATGVTVVTDAAVTAVTAAATDDARDAAAAVPAATAAAGDVAATAGDAAAGSVRASEVRRVAPQRRPAGFTQDKLGWVPWLEPIVLAEATTDQLAVLDGFRAQSPYFRLLARDPDVLRERTAVDKAVFYGHGGLPRAERELAATVTSRLNGCVFCASVHSAQSSALSGRTADVQRLLDEGVGVRIDERRDAITDFAAALAATPPGVTVEHVARLRQVGLGDEEISDIVHATGFFSWANRLMLTLGEPEVPEVVEQGV